MIFRAALFLAAILAIPAAHGEEPQPRKEKPGVVKRAWRSVADAPGKAWESVKKAPRIFGGSGKGGERATKINPKHLVPSIEFEPLPLSLSETRQLKVRFQVRNRIKKLIQLEFPTTQRIEVFLKSKDGRVVEQWSEDQAFENEPSLVTINPGERLEYAVNVATREMEA